MAPILDKSLPGSVPQKTDLLLMAEICQITPEGILIATAEWFLSEMLSENEAKLYELHTVFLPPFFLLFDFITLAFYLLPKFTPKFLSVVQQDQPSVGKRGVSPYSGDSPSHLKREIKISEGKRKHFKNSLRITIIAVQLYAELLQSKQVDFNRIKQEKLCIGLHCAI